MLITKEEKSNGVCWIWSSSVCFVCEMCQLSRSHISKYLAVLLRFNLKLLCMAVICIWWAPLKNYKSNLRFCHCFSTQRDFFCLFLSPFSASRLSASTLRRASGVNSLTGGRQNVWGKAKDGSTLLWSWRWIYFACLKACLSSGRDWYKYRIKSLTDL